MYAVDIFEAMEKIRGVVDRVFRACRGAVGAQKKCFAVVRRLFTLG